jgi:hypothetical protein
MSLLDEIPQYSRFEEIEKLLEKHNLTQRFDDIQQKWVDQYEDWFKKMIIRRVKTNLLGRHEFIPYPLPNIFEQKISDISLCCDGQFVFITMADNTETGLTYSHTFDKNIHVTAITIHWGNKYMQRKVDLDIKYRPLIYN